MVKKAGRISPPPRKERRSLTRRRAGAAAEAKCAAPARPGDEAKANVKQRLRKFMRATRRRRGRDMRGAAMPRESGGGGNSSRLWKASSAHQHHHGSLQRQ